MENKIIDLIPEDLRQTVIDIWNEALQIAGWDDPHKIPFNPSVGYAPSLIDHTRSVTRTALSYADNFKKTFQKDIDRDLLTAGAILHDVSKAIEFMDGNDGPVKSDIGNKIPHSIYSGFLAWKAGLPVDLIHIILTHSPSVEMLPKSIEGLILKYADMMDADAHYFLAELPTILERYT